MNQIQLDEEAIFHVARRIASQDARDDYLDQVCGDRGLRERVDALVLLYEQEASFLESPAVGPLPTVIVARAAPPPEGPGEVIGPYKLLEPIGEGGMGVVFMAEQAYPVRRKVALKVIKPGMDTRQVIARFEAERQALAMMDHPNIACVLDVGSTESGRPYFVMELIRGVPITEYCDREQLPLEGRLDLFVLVCRAVQHAHQKGIIHRDLKPTNVLITLHDGVPVPKVIDFGVAKATSGQLTEKTLYTAFSQLVGTPLYMSPEQAEMSALDIDTRSDIYSLGVLLYELLTGTTPFNAETMRQAAFDEMRRIIREEEPPRPSTRLGSPGVPHTTIPARRNADTLRLGRSMRGELDWIVMKALEKDRRRRYETANDFAADVMRHLADRPVEACPPSARYRLAKLVRRNRVALTTTALVAAALVMGTAVSAWQAVRATRAGRDSRQQATLARRAVDEMYTQFAERVLGDRPHLEPLHREFLEKALAYYQEFARERADDPEVKFEAARARSRVGAIQRRLGMLDQSEATFRQSLTQLEDLASRHPDRDDYRSEFALSSVDFGYLNIDFRKPAEAEFHLKRSVAIMELIGAENSASREDRGRLAHSLGALGTFYAREDRRDEAEAILRRGRALLEELDAQGSSTPIFRSRLSAIDSDLGYVHESAGRLPEAERAYQGAIAQLGSLLSEEPTNPDYRKSLAGIRLRLARVQDRTGRAVEASANYDRGVALLETLRNEFPLVHSYGGLLAMARIELFVHLSRAGQDEQLERLAPRLLELCETLFRDYPTVPEYRWRLTTSLWLLADRHSASPDGRFADPALALKLAGRAVELMPNDKREIRRSLAWARYRVGDWKGCIASLEELDRFAESGDYLGAMAYWRLGEKAKARELFDRSEAWLVGYDGRWMQGPFPPPRIMRSVRDEASALLGVQLPRGELIREPALELKRPSE